MADCSTGRNAAPPTPVWRVGSDLSMDEAVSRAGAVVQNGGVIIYPTETFYALGANPGKTSAVERIFHIKGRDFEKPLPLIAASMDVVRRVAGAWPEDAEKLARAFWPGPLTLILPVGDPPLSASGLASQPLLSPLVHARKGKIAVRVSSHPIAGALASLAGGLLISTSANFSGKPPYKEPGRMLAALLDAVDGLLHAGTLPGTMPSTLVDVTSRSTQLVRVGCLSWETIQSVIA